MEKDFGKRNQLVKKKSIPGKEINSEEINSSKEDINSVKEEINFGNQKEPGKSKETTPEEINSNFTKFPLRKTNHT